MVNVGEQNKPNGGRSILDYSLIVCFTLIILLAILVLDAFEYISVPGAKKATNKFKEMTSAMTSDELLGKLIITLRILYNMETRGMVRVDMNIEGLR